LVDTLFDKDKSDEFPNINADFNGNFLLIRPDFIHQKEDINHKKGIM
jgi:hypothetical protein